MTGGCGHLSNFAPSTATSQMAPLTFVTRFDLYFISEQFSVFVVFIVKNTYKVRLFNKLTISPRDFPDMSCTANMQRLTVSDA
jgi:hypothetical protein